MSAKKNIFLKSFIVTSAIFVCIVLLNAYLDNLREEQVLNQMAGLVGEYEDMQSLILMTDYLDEEAICLAIGATLYDMNNELWELGAKIDSYRQASEDFVQDPFYVEQKIKFNRKEVLYYSLLQKLNHQCNSDITILSYFYKRSEECPDCDSQSFVLSDLTRDFEDIKREGELAVFSFDANMQIPAVQFLIEYYNITEYPCIVIGEQIYCGLQNKGSVTEKLCSEKSDLAIC